MRRAPRMILFLNFEMTETNEERQEENPSRAALKAASRPRPRELHLEDRGRRFRNLGRRILMLVAGMFAAAYGISLIAKTNLGSTPISSVPLVVTEITGYSFDTTTFFCNLLLVLGQAVILRRRFKLAHILQIPSVLVFSIFIDLSMHLLEGFSTSSYAAALAFALFGNLMLAVGVLLQIRSKTLVQPGEGIVLAVSIVTRKPFGYLKIANDVSLVSIAALIGFLWLGYPAQIREGTLISAVLVGLLVKFMDGIRKRITGAD